MSRLGKSIHTFTFRPNRLDKTGFFTKTVKTQLRNKTKPGWSAGNPKKTDTGPASWPPTFPETYTECLPNGTKQCLCIWDINLFRYKEGSSTPNYNQTMAPSRSKIWQLKPHWSFIIFFKGILDPYLFLCAQRRKIQCYIETDKEII